MAAVIGTLLIICTESGADFLLHSFERSVIAQPGRGEGVPGKAIRIAENGQQDMLCADIGVAQRFGFLSRHGQEFAHAGGIRETALRAGGVARHQGFFYLFSQRGDIDSAVFHNADGDALTELQQPKQNMLRSDIVMPESVCLSAGQIHDLLCTWCKIIHGEDLTMFFYY